jgi:membrane fusion protein (multidrug efflux system)
MVEHIHFKPGSKVNKGDFLVQLNAAAELGQLHALQAQVELAKITYKRDEAQFKVHAVSKQTVDTDEWNLKNLQAQVEQQAATVAKKAIRAPFSGYLGINNINPGQYLNVGDTITTLQALDPLYVDFYLPQQELNQLKLGQLVNLNSDAFPNQTFAGTITTIQPLVDDATRNVEVEATIPNPKHQLKPGMFTQVEVQLDTQHKYLTVPQSAISFNSYGDIVYLVKETGTKDKKNQPVLVVKEIFVTSGDNRGDQVAVLTGLKEGDIIVTSGQLKLKNDSIIAVNNTTQPSNDATPKVQNP